MTEQNNGTMKIVLTDKQIQGLAAFAKKEGQRSYTIAHGSIGLFEYEGGGFHPEYTGLVAFSDSAAHGVLQLDGEPDAQSFESVVKPVIEWLSNNGHPHQKALITSTGAELVEGITSHRVDGLQSESVQLAETVNIGELSVQLSLDDSKLKAQLDDPILKRFFNLAELKKAASNELVESKKDDSDNCFKFPLGLKVKVCASGEIGHIKGTAAFSDSCNQYLVHYKAADGRAVDGWFNESELVNGLNMRLPFGAE